MTISKNVYNQLFAHSADQEKVIRLQPTEAKAGAVVYSSKQKIQMWTAEEHDKFLAALEMFPSGPWKRIAEHIGTKTPRQTMTHAQKYRQKIHRRQRGLRNQRKKTDGDESSSSSPSSSSVQSPYSVEEVPANHLNGSSYASNENQDHLNLLASSASSVFGEAHLHGLGNHASPRDFAQSQASFAAARQPLTQQFLPSAQLANLKYDYQAPQHAAAFARPASSHCHGPTMCSQSATPFIKEERPRALPSLANLLHELKAQPAAARCGCNCSAGQAA